jgi:uncharacterized coiled-coil protein SlyX
MSSSHPNPMVETLDIMRKMIDTITLARNQAEQRAAEYAIKIRNLELLVDEQERDLNDLYDQIDSLTNRLL